MKRLPILAIAVVAAVAMALVAGNALAKIQIKNVTKCVALHGDAQDKVHVTFTLYDDGKPVVDTMGNADVKIDDTIVAQVRNATPLPYTFDESIGVPPKKHKMNISYWGDKTTVARDKDPAIGDCLIGGIAEAPDADASSLEATASGGSSTTTYAVIASIAAGIVLLGAGGWYARRRWLS
jgi:hypothetical protein